MHLGPVEALSGELVLLVQSPNGDSKPELLLLQPGHCFIVGSPGAPITSCGVRDLHIESAADLVAVQFLLSKQPLDLLPEVGT